MGNQPFSLLLLLLLLLPLLLISLCYGAPSALYSGRDKHDHKPGGSYNHSSRDPVPPEALYLLHTSDVKALNNMVRMLEMKPPRVYDTGSCRRIDPYDGITCNCNVTVTINNSTRIICRIERLNFQDRDFRGNISSEVGALSYLKALDLSGNKLHGSIPTTLQNLTYLEFLDLSSNQLDGTIPDVFDKMLYLQLINLEFNFLVGSIPPSLGLLPNLGYLYLTSNLLTGPIPSQLGNISALLYMFLGDNQLSGTLSPKLGNLRGLIAMQISGNNFTGNLPDSFKKLTKLEVFAVRGNDLNGRIPDFIGNWPYLRYLHLMGNNFEGILPPTVFNLSRLIQLWVTDVRLDMNSFPPVVNLKSLASLILRKCSITGRIPEYLTRHNLKELDLSYNNLTGEIPTGLEKLDFLCLTRNNFSGSIPKWVPNSDLMDFSYNSFSTDSVMQNNESYYVNTFTPSKLPMESSMPAMNGSCPHEKYTSLHINCGGKGTIINGSYYEADNSTLPFYVSPNKKWAYSSSGDFLSSTLGPRNCTKNMTCGISVPDAPLYASARISPLSLDYYGLCLHNGAYNVTLHFAEIVFSEKDDHSFLGKRIFDIYIQGERVVKDFNIKDEARGPRERVIKIFPANVTGNLLNIHLYWVGKGSIYVRPPQYGPLISAISVTPDYKLGKKLSSGTIAAITTSSVALPLLLLAILWNLGYLGQKKLQNDELEGEELQKRKLTFQHIVEATQNFSSKMEIGRGGSGTVYKAVLRDGGPPLAVKKIIARSIKGFAEYINEVRKLQSLKNENLVQLLGWYTGGDQLLVIFEYMEKNSLHNALFGYSKLVFSWNSRYSICLQIARGLVYLHEVSEPKIIHRDINPSNILLGETLNAKISDFGLAKFYNEEQGTAFTKLCGTHGYMAPEYALRGILSEKTDVYSYGILALEIVTGKSNATYKSSQESDFLFDQACLLWKNGTGNILQLVDASISGEKEYLAQQASRVLSLAMLCTNQAPSLRPTMSQVVSVLDGATSIQELLPAKNANPTNDSKHCITCSCLPVKRTTFSFDGEKSTA